MSLFREMILFIQNTAKGKIPQQALLCWENIHVLKSTQMFSHFSYLKKLNVSHFKSIFNKARFYTKRLPVNSWVYFARLTTTEPSNTQGVGAVVWKSGKNTLPRLPEASLLYRRPELSRVHKELQAVTRRKAPRAVPMLLTSPPHSKMTAGLSVAWENRQLFYLSPPSALLKWVWGQDPHQNRYIATCTVREASRAGRMYQLVSLWGRLQSQEGQKFWLWMVLWLLRWIPAITDVRFVCCKGKKHWIANLECYQNENQASETQLAWHSV